MTASRAHGRPDREFDDLLRGGDVEAGEQVLSGLGQLGALPEHAGGAPPGSRVSLRSDHSDRRRAPRSS